MFLFHGEFDRIVSRQGPAAFSERLLAEGVKAELHIVAGKGHVATFYDETARRKAVTFLNDVLKRDIVEDDE